MDNTNNTIIPETMVALPDEAFEIINDYNKACTAVKEAEKQKEEAKAKLVKLLGSAQIGIYADIKVSYVPRVRESVDTKAFKEQLPDIYKQYVKSTQFMQINITHVK